MKSLLTPEEMEIIVDKINKGEMKWEDITYEVELIRSNAAKKEGNQIKR